MANTHFKLAEMEIASQEEEENEGGKTIFSSDEDEPEAIMNSMNNETELSAGTRMRYGPKRLKDIAASMNSRKRTKKAEDGTTRTKATRRGQSRKRWTDEDEIALLRGIIDFQDKTGKSLSGDKLGFYESFKNSVRFEVNLRRSMDKNTRLREKYIMQAEEGVEPSFLDKNDQERFRLSKAIWGDEEIALRSDVKTKKRSERIETKKRALYSSPNTEEGEGEGNVESPIGVTQTDMFEESYLVQSIEILGVESVKQKWSVVPMETRKRVEEKLKSLYSKEVECKKLEEKLEAKKLECVNERKKLLNVVIPVITNLKRDM